MDRNHLIQLANAYKAAIARDDRTATISAARRLVAAKAPLGPQWPQLASAVMRWRELELALAAIDLWQQQVAPPQAAAFQKASFLSEAGRIEDAWTLLKRLPADFPSVQANAGLKGSLLYNLGRQEESAAEQQRAISAHEKSGRSWQGLAQTAGLTPEQTDKAEELAKSSDFSEPAEHAAMWYAVGAARLKQGDNRGALTAFAAGRASLGREDSYSAEDEQDSVRITQSWTSKTIADRAVRPPASRRQPIFVTGLPRSGTTLVQQILSAHSKVDGGREFNLAVALEATMDGFGIADFDRYLASGGTISDLRDLYLRLVHERLPGEGYFVDKTLQQSRSLGPFSALFPDAPVIWLRRDPMDQAWAIYRTWLGSALASWSFEEIAEHLKLEDRLRTYWQGELGDRMLSLEYSDLVADPNVWIERITRHCGLEPEERQVRFHENSESVSTASAMQVRVPINRKGIGSAEPFREYMQPFLDAFYGTGEAGTGS